MLYTNGNNPVKIAMHLNTKTHPHVFVPLRETKLPLSHKDDKMFRLETRAKIKE